MKVQELVFSRWYNLFSFITKLWFMAVYHAGREVKRVFSLTCLVDTQQKGALVWNFHNTENNTGPNWSFHKVVNTLGLFTSRRHQSLVMIHEAATGAYWSLIDWLISTNTFLLPECEVEPLSPLIEDNRVATIALVTEWEFCHYRRRKKRKWRRRGGEEERRGSLIRKRGGVEAVAGRQATGAGSRTKGCLLP